MERSSESDRPRSLQMECPRCGSTRVERLPPSQISPHPGYKCGECGVVMRASKMLVPYLIVLALGAGLFGLFLFLLLGGEGDHPMPLKGLWLAGLGLVCSGYSIMQLMRPVPRRNRVNSDPN